MVADLTEFAVYADVNTQIRYGVTNEQDPGKLARAGLTAVNIDAFGVSLEAGISQANQVGQSQSAGRELE